MARRNTMVARRYSDALFQVLEGRENLEGALKELQAFSQILEKNKLIAQFFYSPIVGESEKRNALDGIKDKFPLTYRFLIAVVDANRMEVLSEMSSEFAQLKEEAAKELSVEVTTAHPVNQAEIDEIVDYLSNKWALKLNVRTQVDPEILGGFVARARGKLLDASAASQLENLEHRVLSI